VFVSASLPLLAGVLTGCGGGGGGSFFDGGGGGVATGGEASCTVTESLGDGGLPLQVCAEESGVSAQQAQQLQQQCSTQGATAPAGATVRFANGPCPRDHALGGCKLTVAGVTETAWYYDDGSGLQTSADIQSLCATAGAAFVPPNG
jgi:hypothetical protein